MPDDFDIVSDLNSNDGDVSAHGADTQHVNAEPVRAPGETPKKVGTADDTAAKPLSLRDQISSALKGEENTPPVAQQDGGQQRGPDGKFLKATDPAAAAAPADTNTLTPPVAPQVAAPAGLDPQVFASLPAETQASLARTMEDVAAQQNRFAALEPIEQIIGPRIQPWAMGGMAPAQALSQLLALSDYAGRDPGGFIQYFAQNNGVDLEQLVLGMEPAAPVDPAFKALQDELAQVKGQLSGFTQQQQSAAHNDTVNQVVGFASEKDGQGNLLRPHFDELGQAVLPYIGMVKSQNPNWSHTQVLQEAYERACWATPSVRSKLQEAANAAAEAERLRQQTTRVDKARTASASVPSGAPSSPPAAPNDPQRTLRDTIRASIAAAS